MKIISIFTHRTWMIVFRPVRRHNSFFFRKRENWNLQMTALRMIVMVTPYFHIRPPKQQQTPAAWKQQHQREPKSDFFPHKRTSGGKFMSGKFLLLIKTRSEHRRELNQQNVNLSQLCGWWMMCANVRFFGKFRVFFVHFVWPTFTLVTM